MRVIESWNQFLEFIGDSANDDLFFHAVPLNEGIHPAINTPSILFINNLTKKRTYYYGFKHPDIKSLNPLDNQRVIDEISRLRGTKWAADKKSFNQLVPIKDILDVGFAAHCLDNKVFDINDFNTPAHAMIRRNFKGKPGFSNFVPLSKHLEAFTELAEVCSSIIQRATPLSDSFKQFNELIITPLTETETYGLAIDPVVFQEHFGDIFNKPQRVYTQYNFYTATGRPSNRFGGINYAALNKENGSRKAFVSRWGKNGKLILIDYSTFHPRIISYLTNYPIATDVDIYEYLAKLYFNKPVVDDSDIEDAKQITFRQLFGGVQSEYAHIKYLSHLKEFIDFHWKFFNENGYVETPFFKRRITNKHIHTPKPATVFNYILQATEGEISIPVLGKVNEFLKNKKTKAVLYTYDAILFDYCFDDDTIMAAIREIMGLDGKFPTKVFVGDNYHDMERVA